MIREIIHIDEDLCNGCGECIPNCHEGALQIIDNKAVLVSELMCDGLGACIGHCPMSALTVEKREAEAYNETEVMAQMVKKGRNVVVAHLKHLKDHNEKEFLREGIKYLWDHDEFLPFKTSEIVEEVHQLPPLTKEFKLQRNLLQKQNSGCPGSREAVFQIERPTTEMPVKLGSELTHWPVQLHLINPSAAHFRDSDLLIAADCSAFAMGNFHSQYLKNKKLIIACPKLDQGLDSYLLKIKSLIDDAKVKSITVLRMEVPCCGGLSQLVQTAISLSARKIPVKVITVSTRGEVISSSMN